MIYLVIFLIFLIFAIIFGFGKNSSNFAKICYVLECLTLICLAGFRFRVGGDSLSYEDSFFEIPDLKYLLDSDFSEKVYQPLWITLCSICKSFGSFTLLQIVQAIIVNVGMFTIIKRYSQHRFSMVLVYYVIFYLYFNTEILRQAISIIIFLFAYPYLIRKKYLRYYIYIYIYRTYSTHRQSFCLSYHFCMPSSKEISQ